MPRTHSSARQKVELSVVLPCLNEEQTVGRCVHEVRVSFRKHRIKGEVVVADNGSKDCSAKVARRAGARVVSVPKHGYGYALKGGIAAARGTYVVMADADDSYDFEHLPRFLRKLRKGYDLVMGNRFLGGIARGAMPFSHRLGNPVLSGIGRLFFGTPIGDFHCGIRGFRKDSYEHMHLQTHGMEFASEMIVKASLLDMRITEVATRLRKDGRRGQPSHLRTWSDGWKHLRFMMLFAPSWLLLYPGLLLVAGGLVALFALLTTSSTVHPLGMLVAMCVTVLGLETISLWDVGRVFAFGAKVHASRTTDRILRVLSRFETGLSLGLLLATVGGIGISWIASRCDSYASCEHLTLILGVPMVTLALIGMQLMLASMLIGVLRMQRSASNV